MLLIIMLSKDKLRNKKNPMKFINKYKEFVVDNDNYNEDPVISLRSLDGQNTNRQSSDNMNTLSK